MTEERKLPPADAKGVKADRRKRGGVDLDNGAEAQAREHQARTREDAVHSREDAVHSREHTVHSREGTAHLREEAATSREENFRAGEAVQAAANDHMLMLREANERLVSATMVARQLAEEVQAAKAQLEEAKRSAETANRAKSNFVSGMSHDLRTPLTAILGFAQLLEAGTPPLTPIQKVRVEKILGAGWYLLKMIDDTLDLALIESGRVSLSMETVSLAELLGDCEGMVELQAEQCGIRIVFPQFDSPCPVNTDPIRLKQVLLNLLSNALKYSPKDSVVEVVCGQSAAGRLRVSVKDAGKGLPADKLAQLFEPFNRLGQEEGPVEGTGLGLVVSKRLIEMMGGAIGAESTVGVGSVFWIELDPTGTPANPF